MTVPTGPKTLPIVAPSLPPAIDPPMPPACTAVSLSLLSDAAMLMPAKSRESQFDFKKLFAPAAIFAPVLTVSKTPGLILPYAGDES